jgi:hypothetical protein
MCPFTQLKKRAVTNTLAYFGAAAWPRQKFFNIKILRQCYKTFWELKGAGVIVEVPTQALSLSLSLLIYYDPWNTKGGGS